MQSDRNARHLNQQMSGETRKECTAEEDQQDMEVQDPRSHFKIGVQVTVVGTHGIILCEWSRTGLKTRLGYLRGGWP